MNPVLLFAGFLVLGAIWTGICAWVFASARLPVPQYRIETGAAILRRRLLYAASGFVVIIFAASVYWLPYAFTRRNTVGRPQIMVHVLAQQWSFSFSPDKVPAGVPVEFDVTSSDVNHGFGLYDMGGHLVAQTQAMPGYTNRLIFVFKEPGTYLVRCLELCGTPHFAMQSQITVTP